MFPRAGAGWPALALVMTIVGASGAGCAETGSTWNAAGYRQSVFGYAVAFRDAKTQKMAGDDWQVDSHRFDVVHRTWQEKEGPEYTATREQDLNQDGNVDDSEKSEEPIYDLRLTNKKNDGVLWTKAHPFLPEGADRDLEVILDNYVDSLAGHGLYAQGNMFGVERAKTRNFTTFLVSKTVGKVGGHDALTGTIEIAEVDRLKQDPSHRSGVVKVVMLKIRCLTEANCRRGSSPSSPDPELRRWPKTTCRGKPCYARTALLVVGYYNAPKNFKAGEPELDALLSRISFPEAEPLPVPALEVKPAGDKPPDKPADEPPSEPAPSM